MKADDTVPMPSKYRAPPDLPVVLLANTTWLVHNSSPDMMMASDKIGTATYEIEHDVHEKAVLEEVGHYAA